MQQHPLQLGQSLNRPRAPFAPGAGVTVPNPSGSGARHVYENTIKGRPQASSQRFSWSGEHGGLNIHEFEIALQALASVSTQFVDDQFTLLAHEPGQVSCLAAGRCAEVKHSIPGLGGEGGGDPDASRCVHPSPSILKAGPSLGRLQLV